MKLEYKTHICSFNALAQVLNDHSKERWFMEKIFTGEDGHMQIVFARHIEDLSDDTFNIESEIVDKKWYQFWK